MHPPTGASVIKRGPQPEDNPYPVASGAGRRRKGKGGHRYPFQHTPFPPLAMAPRKSRTIRQQYFIRASPKKVFKSISEPQRLTRWFLKDAEISLRKRGRYTFEWQGGYKHTGRVLEVVRGESVTLTWPQFDGDEALGETKVRFSVAPKNDGTLLKIVHSGYPLDERWVDLYAGTHSGWAYYVMNLKSVLEHGHDLRSKHDA